MDSPHKHRPKTSSRTALMLILGSSPMVEGIPAFFAAGKLGIDVIVVMAIVFAISTIATYVLLCMASTVELQRVSLGSFERYGEVLSGVFIALVGRRSICGRRCRTARRRRRPPAAPRRGTGTRNSH